MALLHTAVVAGRVVRPYAAASGLSFFCYIPPRKTSHAYYPSRENRGAPFKTRTQRSPIPYPPRTPSGVAAREQVFRSAVPFWGQPTQLISRLPPKRDCSIERVKTGKLRAQISLLCYVRREDYAHTDLGTDQLNRSPLQNMNKDTRDRSIRVNGVLNAVPYFGGVFTYFAFFLYVVFTLRLTSCDVGIPKGRVACYRT